jgi:predicted nucleotidyltransferase
VTAVRPNFGGLASEAQALDAVVVRIVGAIDPGAIWLLGSRARGDARPDSDFDLGSSARDGKSMRRSAHD